MAKPRFPGKPHRFLSRNRTRVSTTSSSNEDDTFDVVGKVCLGLAVFKHSFGDYEENFLPGVNGFKGFTSREISESKRRAKRKHEEADRNDVNDTSSTFLFPFPLPFLAPNATSAIDEPKNKTEENKEKIIDAPASKRARRKGGGRKLSLPPKLENATQEPVIITEIKEELPPPLLPSVSILPQVEGPLSWTGHPLIVEGKRRWKPTYKVLQGPSSLEDSRRLGGEAWAFGARQINRAVEAPAPIGGKFVTGSAEKGQQGKSSTSSTGIRPSGGGILREARLRLDSTVSGSEDGEWVRRMMDETEKIKSSSSEVTKSAPKNEIPEKSTPEKDALDSEISPARVYCRICKGAMSRRFSKRKAGKRGVWSCKACREFVAEMMKKLRNNKNGENGKEKDGPSSDEFLACRGGKGKCTEEESWPPPPPQRCVPCWLRLCLNAPAPHLVPCPVNRAALRKILPTSSSSISVKAPEKRAKKRRGQKFVHHKSKRQKVAAEGPRVKHVCRSALAVLGRPPATFPAHGPLKAHGGEAANAQENVSSGEVNEAEESTKEQSEANGPQDKINEASTPPAANSTGGAHQWWKQRKGMHRRRKKGRLTLVLPRRDVKPLSHFAPKIQQTAKTGPSPAVKAPKPVPHMDYGPPLQLEGYPFRSDAAEIFKNGYGVIQVAPNIMPVQPICFLCGSGGKQWLVHCALCCEPFHTFCVEWAGWDVFDGWDVPIKGSRKTQKGKIFMPLEWLCRRCSLCHACGLPAYIPGSGMPSVNPKDKKLKEIKQPDKKDKAEEEGEVSKKKKKEAEGDAEEEGGKEDELVEDMGTRTCNVCHKCYHGCCLGSSPENQKNTDLELFKDRDRPWVCSSCLKCHSCGRPSVAGSVPRRQHEEANNNEQYDSEEPGPDDLLMCSQCISLHKKGNFCPLCHVVYRDTDFDALMMQCAQCSCWVHASCEGLTDDQYHLLSLLPSSVEFTCSPCTSQSCPTWRKALAKKLHQGLERVYEVLAEAVKAVNTLSLPSPGALSALTSSNTNQDGSVNVIDKPELEPPSNQTTIKACEVAGKDNQLSGDSIAFSDDNTIDGESCNRSGNSSKNTENINHTKVSGVVSENGISSRSKAAEALVDVKKRIKCGGFGGPNDFYKAVEDVFLDEDLVLSALRDALVKVFPWVKPKVCSRDIKKRLNSFYNDHCYSSSSKTSELLNWVPKVDSKLTNVQLEASTIEASSISCDLQTSNNTLEENLEISKVSNPKNANESVSKSKEPKNPNENLWMDPTDYIPNLKVYSFASALRRRSRNRSMLRLSTKDFAAKSYSSNHSSDNELHVKLENTKNIMTYKSVLAKIKEEPFASDNVPSCTDELVTDSVKVADKSKEDIKIPDKTEDLSMQAEPDLYTESKSLLNSKDGENIITDSQLAIPNKNNANSNIPQLENKDQSGEEEKQRDRKSDTLPSKSPTNVDNQVVSSAVDGRRCLFCHVRGDADVEREGRLLLASSFGDWVHCNCALWSAEVYEEKGGLLMKVREAVNRGRRVRCALCRDTGATLGCCLRGCPDSYHLGCALRSGCLLLEDKSVYCSQHIPAEHKNGGNVELSLKRPVQVDTEGPNGSVLWRWKKPGRAKRKPGENCATFAANTLRFTVGSLHVESLGKIVPGVVRGQFLRPPESKNKDDEEEEMRWCEGGVSLAKKVEDGKKIPEMLAAGGAPVVVPVGFSCTRLYWSSVEPWKIVEYRIQTVLVISEVDETEVTISEEREESVNEDHDSHKHVTVDHTAEADDSDSCRNTEEQPDLIVSPDLNDEILKELPAGFFDNKKLVHSILVGLLKGSNNGESQNDGACSLPELSEEEKRQKSHIDEEHPPSPLHAYMSEQGVLVSRHNKPISVVQPVSKETLLNTDTASQAWELTCEMRPAQTPPPSASPTMTGAAESIPELSSLMKPHSKPPIWSEGSKEIWKHLTPIPQLDGNADPSSSSSEGGGSSPVRTSPGRESSQPLPCLLACRIKQQSLARSEPGGGGPVKCNECRRTYRTREGFERHLCGTPLPLSSTSSDSDSEDRTSRRVSSESDAPVSEEIQSRSPEIAESFDELPIKEAMDTEKKVTSEEANNSNVFIEAQASDEGEKVNSLTEACGVPVSESTLDVLSQNPVSTNSLPEMPNRIPVQSVESDSDGKIISDHFEINNSGDKNMSSNEHHDQTKQVSCEAVENILSVARRVDPLPNSNNYSTDVEKVIQKSGKNSINNVVRAVTAKDGAWKGLVNDTCTSRVTKKQTAFVQPLCYVNGKRKISSGTQNITKTRFNESQEENFICNSQLISQGGIPQASIIQGPLPTQGNNFQVIVRELPSSNAVPQFAENFRQQTGHTLQYLTTIDPATFHQTNTLSQPQGIVGLIQGAPQIMQTQTLISSQQVVASSPIVLAPQQQTLIYNPVTACLETVQQQQSSFILAPPPPPTFTIPVSTALSYSINQDVPQMYFHSSPMPPPALPHVPATPQLETVIQSDPNWSLPSVYQIQQNQPVEQVQNYVMENPTPAAPLANMPSSEPVYIPEEGHSDSQSQTDSAQSQFHPTKRKRTFHVYSKPGEGHKAYRRDDKTGNYLPVVDMSDDSARSLKINSETDVNEELSTAFYDSMVKETMKKDLVGARRRSVLRKVDGASVSSFVQGVEPIEKQDISKGVRTVQTPSRWRLPTNVSFLSDKDNEDQILNQKDLNFVEHRQHKMNNSSNRISRETEKITKRVESASVMYQVHSTDGFTVQSDTPDKIWDQIFKTVQDARLAHGLTPLPRNPFAPIAGSKPFLGAETLALSHKGLRYLLNQLPGASHLLETKLGGSEIHSTMLPPHKLFSRAHLSLSTQTVTTETASVPPPPSSPPLPENPSGCARTEPFKCPPPLPNPTVVGGSSSSVEKRKWRHRDIFGWLASPHRKLPMAPLPTQESEQNGGGNRRATSLDLPMAMRFRHLKETSRETVGVYRSHIHGRGLFCLKDIEAGEMVIEYSGEVIRSSLTDTREKTYEAKGMGCYMFRIDEQTVVDATMRGNAARFINHSCDPNCYSRVVDILGKKHILIFALRRIPRGEELTYDYKFPFEDVKIPCHCASKRCRKYLN